MMNRVLCAKGAGRLFFAILLLAGMFAGCGESRKPQATVVATNAWTAAYAVAAGVEDCHVLTPYDLQHPPEYELKPDDIRIISGAKLFVYSGYETMMKRLTDEGTTTKLTMIKIQTDYNPANMKKAILDIAAAAGTTEKAGANIKELEAAFAACREELAMAGVTEKPIVVHYYQKVLAELFGVKVAGAFGPAPLEAKQIADLSKTGAIVAIDNWHNPVASPLSETLGGLKIAEFINFPGKGNTRTLVDVLNYNKAQLLEVLKK